MIRRRPWLWLLALLWLLGLAKVLKAFCCRPRPPRPPRDPSDRPQRTHGCAPVPPFVHRKPDPLLYSQSFLMGQGLAVTWDNPDIHLEKGGVPVASTELEPDTVYDVIAQIWNGSVDAPAAGVPVRFSFLSFGVNTVSTPIGTTAVDLPVKGSAGLPAAAHMAWRTPATPGHYCLQIEAVWADDANPLNNLGQENADVKPLNSPHAAFVFPVRNDERRDRRLRLEADTYTLPALRSCDRERPAPTPAPSAEERERRVAAARARHDRAAHGIPPGWQVVIDPAELALAPEQEREVTVDVTAPDGFSGRQALNVNAFEGERLIGGVTLYVEGTA
jgi:hypothetical protein